MITPIDWEEFETPNGKQDLLDGILSNSIYDTVIPVIVDYLPDFQINGLLSFELPGIEDTIYAFAQQVEFHSSGNFVWNGKITTSKGNMMVVEKNEDVYGYFLIDSTLVYELVDLGNRSNLLIKYSTTFIDSARCALGDGELEDFSTDVDLTSRGDCEEDTKFVRILVLYTQNAAERIDPEQKADLFVTQLNMALHNSDIAANELRFQLADVQELSGFEETNSIGADLGSLKNIVLNSSPDIREEPGADVVVLLTDGNYENCRKVGLAYQQNYGNTNWAFALVEGDGSLNYTFAHEVAHTFGCRHIHDHSQEPDYAQGYHWKHNGRRRSTIMISGGSGKQTRILHFSNPDVDFDGHVTGYEDYNNNARQLRESNDILADNFCYDPEMLIGIEGPRYGIEGVLYTWSAYALECDEIVNYKWEVSYDGITYTIYANSSTADEISLYLPAGYHLFIRLTITCADDQVQTTFLHVFNFSGSIDPLVDHSTNDEPKSEDVLESIFASPNPSLGELVISFSLSRASMIQLFRNDILGNENLITEGAFDAGVNKIRDPIISEIQGFYIYTLVAVKERKSILTFLNR